jgi:hypothetical protein
MVTDVRLLAPCFALLVLGASPAAQAKALDRTYVRTSLDDDSTAEAPRQPRRMRSTLDVPSQAAFPLDPQGRLIRLSLGEGGPSYGRLAPGKAQARRVRMTLD